MKPSFCAFNFAFAIASLWACVSTGPDSSEASGGRSPADCVASLSTVVGTPIESVASGTIVSDPRPLPEGFDDPVVIAVEDEYFLKGRSQKASFELVYSGVSRPMKGGGDAPVEAADILGDATRDVVILSARSKSLDPYLVACTAVKPVFEGGYWYFVPGMHIPTEMKWLSYAPAAPREFRSMYDHALEDENASGSTFFAWWSLIKTRLDAYPVKAVEAGVEGYAQDIDFNGMTLRLLYQEGFLDYLKNEYTLGQTIYLYLQISQIDGFQKKYICYVRDFSLVPPEEIVENRIKAILGEKRGK